MKNLRVIPLLAASVLLVSLTACSKQGDTSGNTSKTTGASMTESQTTSGSSDGTGETSGSEGASTGGSTSGSQGGNNSGTKATTKGKTSGSTAGSSAVSKKTTYFKVEDYGAKGDGKTDDGLAVYKAINAAARDESGEKIVQFKANTTYYLASAPANASFKRVINCIGADNLKIRGSNTKLLMKAPYRVAYFYEGSNIEFSGFVIDYSPKPFALGEVKSINKSGAYIDFSTDVELGFTGTVSPDAPYFAFRNRKDERRHYNITKMTKLGAKSYRFYFTNADYVGLAVMGEDFILPVYGSSHNIGGLFSITGVKNFEMKNVSVYAMPDFGFDVRGNLGYTKFTNVRIEPAPGSDIYLASWRDGFHVKDNLSQMTWDNCYIGPLGDDAFNLSTVICNVDFYNEDLRTISMTPTEGGSTRDGLAVGDELVAYNMRTGESYGTAKIEKVLPANGAVNIKIDRNLPIVRESQIAFYRFNKNFIVKNSYIEGTVRVRTTGLFQNCKFSVFWVRVENESYVEGPVPKDITFKNCTFTTPYSANAKIFHVGTLMASGIGGTPKYKCKNIVLDNCTFTKGTYGADSGNQLTIK